VIVPWYIIFEMLYLVEADQLGDLTVLGRTRKSGSGSYIRRNKSLGGVGTTENGTHVKLVLDKVWGTKNKKRRKGSVKKHQGLNTR
jgi:hypothetical protein